MCNLWVRYSFPKIALVEPHLLPPTLESISEPVARRFAFLILLTIFLASHCLLEFSYSLPSTIRFGFPKLPIVVVSPGFWLF